MFIKLFCKQQCSKINELRLFINMLNQLYSLKDKVYGKNLLLSFWGWKKVSLP